MKATTKYIVTGISLLVAYAFFSWLYGWWPFKKIEADVAAAEVAKLPSAPEFKKGDRVIYFSPHPDDESLSGGGTMTKALEAGAEVFICWFCAGDGFELDAAWLVAQGYLTNADTLFLHNADAMLDLGRTRLGEARNAGTALKVPASHMFFLGYGDGTSTPMSIYPDSVITSSFTKVAKGPYPNTISYNEPYMGRLAEQHIGALIDSLKPTIVYAPAPIDNQADHQATSFFVSKAMQSRNMLPRLRHFIVHGGDYIVSDANVTEYPMPHGLHEQMALGTPIIGKQYQWVKNTISQPAETTKYAAIRCHVSQMKIMGGIMEGWVRTNEIYTILDSTQLGLPQQYYFHPEKH